MKEILIILLIILQTTHAMCYTVINPSPFYEGDFYLENGEVVRNSKYKMMRGEIDHDNDTIINGIIYNVYENYAIAHQLWNENASNIRILSTFDKGGQTINVIYVLFKTFVNNTKIKKVTIGDASKRLKYRNVDRGFDIHDSTFTDCQNLKEIHLGNDVKYIGYMSFHNAAIKKLHITQNVKAIYDYAFADCKRLKRVTFDDSSSCAINGEAFRNTRIKKIHIPANIKWIHPLAFDGSKLKKIDIDRRNNLLCSYNNMLLSKNKILITVIDKNTAKLTLPDSLECIDRFSLYNCINIKEILIPNSVQKINEYAFANCRKLEKIVIPQSVYKIGKGAFYGCDNLEYAFIQDNPKYINVDKEAVPPKTKVIYLPINCFFERF